MEPVILKFDTPPDQIEIIDNVLNNIYTRDLGETVSKIIEIRKDRYPATDREIFAEDEEMMKIAKKQREEILSQGIREKYGCSCEDESCPHKSQISPIAQFLASRCTGKVINLKAWHPFDYPVLRLDDSALSPIFIPGIQEISDHINMIRVAYRKKFIFDSHGYSQSGFHS